MRIIVWLMALIALAMPRALAQPLVENGFLLPVTIDGQVYRLEAYVAVPKSASGPLPIAVISHGTNGDSVENEITHASNFRLIARDFARRGWYAISITRRGFGVSEGQAKWPGACDIPTRYLPVFDAYAADVLAAVDVIAKRPGLDPSRVLFMGGSTGGLSSLLAASRYKGGKAYAINFAGGMRSSQCKEWVEQAAAVFTEAGKGNPAPSIWFYAQNDSLFGPTQAERFLAAYRKAGGHAQLTQYPPVSEDGHYIFTEWQGREKWFPEVDRFLAAHNLPHLKDADIEAMAQKLKLQGRQRASLERYMRLPGEKALIISGGGDALYWNYGGGSRNNASKKALDSCNAKSNAKANPKGCKVLLVNHDAPPASAAPAQNPANAVPAR